MAFNTCDERFYLFLKKNTYSALKYFKRQSCLLYTSDAADDSTNV